MKVKADKEIKMLSYIIEKSFNKVDYIGYARFYVIVMDDLNNPIFSMLTHFQTKRQAELAYLKQTSLTFTCEVR